MFKSNKLVLETQYKNFDIKIREINHKRLSLYVNEIECDFLYSSDFKKKAFLENKNNKILVIVKRKLLGYSLTIFVDDVQIKYHEAF